jgi:tetratricopeptide (TPR) repeat protein
MYAPYIQMRVPAHLWASDDFTVAQYYFNHDDDPSGPYDLSKAQFFYDKAIAANPAQNPLLWYQSGRVDFINGDFNNALYKFSKQQEYFFDVIPNVYYMTGLTYAYRARVSGSADDWVQAEKDFSKAVEVFYDAPWPYVDLAWVYFSQGKFEEMKPVLEKGLSHEANNPWLLNMYGLALLNTGEKALAHEYFLFAYEKALALTVADWGKSYPGNNPDLWDDGLLEFKSLIKKNIELTAGS